MKVLVIFGSKSDEKVYSKIVDELKRNTIDYKLRVCSAHRTPELLDKILQEESYNFIIAGAGLAAHLPGVIASKTLSPVVGVPCSGNFEGLDAFLSIMQMPPGVPVLCSSVDGCLFDSNIFKTFSGINITGNTSNQALLKSISVLGELKMPCQFNPTTKEEFINLRFSSLDELEKDIKDDVIIKRNHFVITIPLLENSEAKHAVLLFEKLKRSGSFCVGLNRGDNAALAAVQILGRHQEELAKYRESMKAKIIGDDTLNSSETSKITIFDETSRDETIRSQLNNTLKETNFLFLGKKKKGKVRDVYTDESTMYLVATDRQSAFDRNLANIPFKGQVLTQTSLFWFENTKDIIQNHIISVPDPNVVVCKKLKVFPIEMVIRGYLTGVTSTAAWTAYEKGERLFCGNVLPEGMVKNQRFETPIITPTTKSEIHDEKISAEEIVRRGLMTQQQWDFLAEKSLQLFKRGTEIAAENGLILVDTKYEFGYDEDGKIYLIDEIHTPDSSRFWIKETYQERFSRGEEPDNIDKEFLRLWFKEHCDPYNDAVLPEAPEELVVELSKRYIQLYEMITGNNFEPEVGDVSERIKSNLAV